MKALSSSVITWRTSTRPQVVQMCSMGSSQFFGRTCGLQKMYEGYLGGLSLVEAAAQVGQSRTHASVKRMLQNPHYLGDDFYPALIDKETFDAFETERIRREKALGRDERQKKAPDTLPAPTTFRMRKKAQVFNDPYRQAEYMYSLIESEV